MFVYRDDREGAEARVVGAVVERRCARRRKEEFLGIMALKNTLWALPNLHVTLLKLGCAKSDWRIWKSNR